MDCEQGDIFCNTLHWQAWLLLKVKKKNTERNKNSVELNKYKSVHCLALVNPVNPTELEVEEKNDFKRKKKEKQRKEETKMT